MIMYSFLFLLAISKGLCDVEFSARSRNFSIELLHFSQMEADGHVVISPFGIWSLMTGIALGTSGESYEQIRRAFILPKSYTKLCEGYKELMGSVLNPTTNGVTLTSKNYVFLDDGFSVFPEFRRMVHEDFNASIKVLDFEDTEAAARIANNYIQSSGGRVSNVLRSDDFDESRMILTNVISFKGLWSFPFNASETTKQPFYDESKRKIGEVNMMYMKGVFRWSNVQKLKGFVLELPYGDDETYSMLFILPYNKVKLIDMYQNFAQTSLTDVMEQLAADEEYYDGESEVIVHIPRFKISTNVIMNKPLNSMGVYDIFDPEVAAFDRVTKEKIFVSTIIHKADIEVTESGTVASASSTATFSFKSLPPHFEANRPFVYLVLEKKTTTVIFAGIYSKPSLY